MSPVTDAADLTHDLAGLLDGSLRHVHLAIDRIGRNASRESLAHLETAQEAMHQMAALLKASRDGRPPKFSAGVAQTLGQSAQRAARLCTLKAQQLGVILTIELSDTAAALPSGPLRRIFDNALRNSLEAVASNGATGEEPPRITLAARLLDGELLVTITDTGPGPVPEMCDSQGLVRVGRSTKGQGGQGLKLMNSLVEQVNGAITLKRRDEGGAILELRCPVTALRQSVVNRVS